MKISVYITSYNQKEFLKVAIDSVLNQTLKPFEIIIVDDASTDGSQEVIKEYFDKHESVKYFLHPKNHGVAQARITALGNVKGDYVTYVDGDDVLLPNKLAIESRIIANTSCDVAFSNNAYVLEHDLDNVQWFWMNNDLVMDNKTNVFVKTLIRDYPRSSLFRMELVNYEKLKSIGFHDPNLNIYEDYDLRIRMAKECTFEFSPEVTSKVRISTKGLSRSKKEAHFKALSYIFEKYKKDIEALDPELRSMVYSKLKQILAQYKTVNEKQKNYKNFSLKKKLSSLIKRFT